MKKKGFTLIELILSLVLVGIILITMIGTLLRLRETYSIVNDNIEIRTYQSLVSKVLNDHFIKNGGITSVTCESKVKCNIVLGNASEMTLEIAKFTEDLSENSISDNTEITREVTTLKYYGNGYSYLKTIKMKKYVNDETETTSGYNFTEIDVNSYNYDNASNSNLYDLFTNITIKTNNPKYNVELYSSSIVNTVQRIYFQVPPNWSNVYVYLYNETAGTNNAAWPGQAATSTGSNGIYQFDVTSSTLANYEGIIFNNNGSGDNARQTVDLTIPSNAVGKIFVPEINKVANTMRLFFTGSSSWNTHIYVWRNSDKAKEAKWPGTVMSKISNGGFSYVIDRSSVNYDMMIFNNGSGGTGNQTADLSIPTCQDMTYKFNGVAIRKYYLGSWYDYETWVSSGYSSWNTNDYASFAACE